jgi:hypothetical protein
MGEGGKNVSNFQFSVDFQPSDGGYAGDFKEDRWNECDSHTIRI